MIEEAHRGRWFEELLVEQCAPTLTGLKPASLFRYQADDRIESVQAAVHWARELEPYGITVRVLKVCPKTGASLIYLYRKTELLRLLAEPAVLNFLKGSGYETEGGGDQLLRQLSRRLCLEEEFPHEIGVFLGYPLEDVEGFIRHRGRNFSLCGYWKVYGDPEEAQIKFERYRCCTVHCMEQLRSGVSIIHMIAA